MANYKGIQKAVLAIIRRACKPVQADGMGLKYITTHQVNEQFKETRPDILEPYPRIKQALYQLQRETKYRDPRIKRYRDKKTNKKGWVPIIE